MKEMQKFTPSAFYLQYASFVIVLILVILMDIAFFVFSIIEMNKDGASSILSLQSILIIFISVLLVSLLSILGLKRLGDKNIKSMSLSFFDDDSLLIKDNVSYDDENETSIRPSDISLFQFIPNRFTAADLAVVNYKSGYISGFEQKRSQQENIPPKKVAYIRYKYYLNNSAMNECLAEFILKSSAERGNGVDRFIAKYSKKGS